MIFQRSLLREFTATGSAAFFVLLAITITTQLIRFLGYAARGNISSDAVLTFLGFASLRYLPHLLSITLFISILMWMLPPQEIRAFLDGPVCTTINAMLSRLQIFSVMPK